jgi:chromosome segregation ATPase
MISVPAQELTDKQKEDLDKAEQASQALSEETSKLKSQMDDIRQQAQALKHGGSKDDYNALNDKLQQLKSDATAAQARFDSLGIPDYQYSYGRVKNVQDWADLASHDCKQAAEASGDNEDVRATAHFNMQNNLDEIDHQLHGTS